MIDVSDRKKMLQTSMVGEDLVKLLESIGVARLADLQGKDAKSLMTRINDKAGHNIARGPLTEQALFNLIAEADQNGNSSNKA